MGSGDYNGASSPKDSAKARLDGNDLKNSNLEVGKGSPSVSSKSGKMKNYRSKPHLKRLISTGSVVPKLVYSVDDDVSDAMDDEELLKRDREYLEWYTDTLREIYATKNKRNSLKNDISEDSSCKADKAANIEEDIVNNIISAEQNLRILKEIEDNDTGNSRREDVNNREDRILEESEALDEEMLAQREVINEADRNSVTSSSSSETLESLNLRERQDAINSTHPFGIKIWKPSLYKKKRSVATRADEDIHDFDHRATYSISFFVRFFNFLWSLTFGLTLFMLCALGAVIVTVLSGFGASKQSNVYARLLFRLAKYWIYPFGKFILLRKDENYLEEDEAEGRTLSEYYKWRSQDESRLFFAPPRRKTAGTESRPLIKDHKGRNLRDTYNVDSSEDVINYGSAINDSSNETTVPLDMKKRFFGRGSWTWSRIVFYVYFYGILQPIMLLVSIGCYLIVFTIPMSNLSLVLLDHLRRHPLALKFLSESDYRQENMSNIDEDYSVVLCTYRSCGLHYYKYTIDGTNIFFINLLFAVMFVIFDFYVLKEKLQWETWYTESSFLFCACLFSVIPLAYFIGQAVASISAQSSMGVGAVINAFFSTIVEIFLYCVALNESKGKLVEGSMIGSILGGVLLLPGLSMCGGALKRKTQRYNPHSAGVSSTMLLFAMLTMFAPSLFYQIYGTYELECRSCKPEVNNNSNSVEDDCAICRFVQPNFSLSPLYYNVIRPFSLIVAIALFLAYTCGLLFTLRTHASLIWATNSHEQTTGKREDYLRSPSLISLDNANQTKVPKTQRKPTPRTSPLVERGIISPPSQNSTSLRNRGAKIATVNKQNNKHPSSNEAYAVSRSKETEDIEENGGHDAPNWSRTKSTVILLGATLLYAIIAEILVQTVDSVLSSFHISPKFLGLTVFALVPNTTEFLNAISFAVNGNVALSMEIGSAYALQVVLIQIPCLVVYSMIKGFDNVDQIFSLVFPRWDIIATLISIYLFTYVYAEGKSNYFKGVILMLIYAVVLIGFWFNNNLTDLLDNSFIGTFNFQNLGGQK